MKHGTRSELHAVMQSVLIDTNSTQVIVVGVTPTL